MLSVQPGDVKKTAADIEAIRRDLGFEPSIPLVDGIPKIIERRFDCHKTRTRLSIQLEGVFVVAFQGRILILFFEYAVADGQ